MACYRDSLNVFVFTSTNGLGLFLMMKLRTGAVNEGGLVMVMNL
jgi:hypothetical protein